MMKRFGLTIGVLALASSAALAQNAATRPKDATARPPATQKVRDVLANPFYAGLVKELKLSDDQVQKLRQAAQAKADALAEFDKSEDGQKLIKLRADSSQARKDGDMDKSRSLYKDSVPLQQQRDKIDAQEQAKVLAVLTPEQQKQFRGYELYTGMLSWMSKAGFTDAQKAKIREMAGEYAPKMAAETDANKRSRIRLELHDKIVSDVLTPEQREKIATTAPVTRPASPAKPAVGAAKGID